MFGRYSETFGAISRCVYAPTDKEIRQHKDKALIQAYSQKTEGFDKHFFWYQHLNFLEKSLRKMLIEQGRLRITIVWLYRPLRVLKGMALFTQTVINFCLLNYDHFAICKTSKCKKQPSYLIYHPEYCDFSKEHLPGEAGIRIFANNECKNNSEIIFETRLRLSLSEFIYSVFFFCKAPYIPANQVAKAVLFKKFLAKLQSERRLPQGLKSIFIYEGSTPQASILIEFFRSLDIATHQYYIQPVAPYQLLWIAKADYLLMAKFPSISGEKNHTQHSYKVKFKQVQLRKKELRDVNLQKNKKVGLAVEMLYMNVTNKLDDLKSILNWCDAHQSIEPVLKFHPQIMKRPEYVLDHYLSLFGIPNKENVFFGDASEFLDSIDILITNSESTIIQDALRVGVPAIYFGRDLSVYIEELTTLAPNLLFVCHETETLGELINHTANLSASTREKALDDFIFLANGSIK